MLKKQGRNRAHTVYTVRRNNDRKNDFTHTSRPDTHANNTELLNYSASTLWYGLWVWSVAVVAVAAGDTDNTKNVKHTVLCSLRPRESSMLRALPAPALPCGVVVAQQSTINESPCLSFHPTPHRLLPLNATAMP